LSENLPQHPDLSDMELLQAINEMEIVTNTENAAFLLLTVIAPIASNRPNLIEHLLPRFLFPLYLSGFERAQQVIEWLQSHLNSPKPFDGMGEIGLNWIRELVGRSELIQQTLDRLIDDTNEQALDEIRRYFAPFSRISPERIQFHNHWDDKILSEKPRGIIFIQGSGVDEEDEAIAAHYEHITLKTFESLTEIVSKHDPEGKLFLSVLNWEGYFDLLKTIKDRNIYEVFLDANPDDVQIVWVYNDRGFRVVTRDSINYHLLESYTLDLLQQP